MRQTQAETKQPKISFVLASQGGIVDPDTRPRLRGIAFRHVNTRDLPASTYSARLRYQYEWGGLELPGLLDTVLR